MTPTESKGLFAKLNLFRECAEYNLGIWECPSFIFLILGAVNVLAMISTYFIANRFTEEPEFVALIVIIVTAIFFIISHTVTQGFDKLAQANKMKTEFVSIASHQLRTPLSAMRWTLNLLNEKHQTDTQGQQNQEQTNANYISLIKESNERMIELVNDLLDVSRIEMGRIILNPQQINLYILIQKIIENFSPLAQASNVEITLEAPETLPNIYADAEKVSLVIQNLIDNAIKYIKGRGAVKISAQANGGSVKVSVKDTGVGIPKIQQKHIFQKFFRSDNIMKHQTIGTGLGLFIAKAVIEDSGGKIWFESEENKGTTFYFTLPIYK
ncbi:HAMP domain-containing histidine kinase [Patescibacteria group bacterium]|nr:HAMP domain-containing histidine kinase [Patescibacteria group bacterium]